jgi:glycosyltransferase involved in cell wall biosynthesis
MKISGFTFIRNGIKLQYPFIESIQSILPLCDEMIVVAGNSNDGTREAVLNIASSKIRIIDTIWDETLREGGEILAVQTNIGLDAITGDWGFYLQGDEVVHEKDLQKIEDAAKHNLGNKMVDGLLFDWYHFFGNYNYIAAPDARGTYPYEVRVIRNNKMIRSFRDAQGFRRFESADAMRKGTALQKLRVKKTGVHIFHYGKVRGPQAELMRAKSFHRLWHDDEWMKNFSLDKEQYDYVTKFPLSIFKGSHPAVMKDRIEKLNWNFIPRKEEKKIPLKYKLLNLLNQLTGWRPFEFRNYVVIK